MRFYLKARLYNLLIDPLVSGLKQIVEEKTVNASRVIDIACGTGTLAFAIARRGVHITAIDLDEEMISFAISRAVRKGITNAWFEIRDASDLSLYNDGEFDVAVTSLAVHQFKEELAIKILTEMKRISGKVIIADYNCPMPSGLSKSLAYGIERMAKGDHHQNFINYISRGGLKWFTATAGLVIRSEAIKGGGVFVVVECS
jgi:ubiquinone/menaquinone biosynthesis C-methylase UbiE